MAIPISSDRLLATLRAEGLNPRTTSNWTTHNRNHMGSWGGVNGIVIHHTAGTSSLNLCINGRSDLPGPLCHAHLAKDGTLTLISNGRANHAGNFAQNAHDAVINESSVHPRPSSVEPVDGNAHYYGIEIENLGNGIDPYPTTQYTTAVKWAAAICRAYGWSENSIIGHKEGTTRKIDPSFNMNTFRTDVRNQLNHIEDDMAITDDDVEKIAKAAARQVAIYTDTRFGSRDARQLWDDAANWTKVAERVGKTDGIYEAPSTAAEGNTHWTLESYITDMHRLLLSIESKLDALGISPDSVVNKLKDTLNSVELHMQMTAE